MDIILGHYIEGPPNIKIDIIYRDLQRCSLALLTEFSKYTVYIISKITSNCVTIYNLQSCLTTPPIKLHLMNSKDSQFFKDIQSYETIIH
jgi:hypothetical protein